MSTPLDSISEHHNQMQEDLEELIASVREHGSDGPLEELSSFLRDEIVPHATGEENHLYPEVDELVREHGTPTATMSVDHEWIESSIDEVSERLRSIGENGREVPRELLDRLVELNAILALHLRKEEEAFLPLLKEHLSREEQQAIIDGLHDEYEDDPELDVRSLAPPERHPVITEEVDQLEPGKALVLVNDHDPKPLYYELRSLRGDTFTWDYLQEGPQEWRVRIEKTAEPDEEDLERSANLDLRNIPDADRKQTVFHRYQLLDKGESMELLDDSEMEELYDALRDRHGDAFSWVPLEEQDDGHRVRVRRGGAEAGSGHSDLTVAEELDVRELPPKQRHKQIFERYENLDRNTAFVLVNDHDPKPLYYQFEAEKGDRFSWSYLREGPDVWKVEIGKRGDRNE